MAKAVKKPNAVKNVSTKQKGTIVGTALRSEYVDPIDLLNGLRNLRVDSIYVRDMKNHCLLARYASNGERIYELERLLTNS